MKKLNSLKIVRELEQRRKGVIMVECLCDCGKTHTASRFAVTSGNTKSCGCLKLKSCSINGLSNKTHGMSYRDFYGSYSKMLYRCNNKDSERYRDYGGRGIKVCKEWQDSPTNFLRDMGERPSKKHSIERVDNERGYFKENCIWATSSQQNSNKRKPKNQSKFGTGIYKVKNRFYSYNKEKYIGSFKTVQGAILAREGDING
jgi:hypothetical protein